MSKTIKETYKLYKKILIKGEKKGELNTLKKRIKFIFRTLILFPYSLQIGKFILNHKYLKNEVFKYPILISKIHRPYLKKLNSYSRKTSSIIYTYKNIDSLFSKNIQKSLYLNGDISIANFTGKNEKKFTIKLNIYPNFDKEGELQLKIYDDQNISLSTLTFSFIQSKNKLPILFIGGVQGTHKSIDKDYIKNATKNLYGIFPKKILIESLYYLENSLNQKFTKISVGNSSHVYKAQRYIRKRKILSDYDEFFESFGSIKLKNNTWLLPEKIVKKELEDIPSKKRSSYINKFNLLTNLSKSINLNINIL